MKLTYKVRRNNEGKIIEKYFAIENFTYQEKQRILQVFANNGGGRLLDTYDYKAMIIAYDKIWSPLQPSRIESKNFITWQRLCRLSL